MSGNAATQRRVLRLDPRDNALVALADLHKGETVHFAGEDYSLLSDVPAKHKFLTQDVSAGGDVIMYGVLVGKTAEALRRGDLLSTRNLRHAAAEFHEMESAPRWSPPDVSRWRACTATENRRTFATFRFLKTSPLPPMRECFAMSMASSF